VIDYVLAAEQRKGRIVTLGNALTELLTDISEAGPHDRHDPAA
jgi:hypothetical protein